MPRITFGIIVLNNEPFNRYLLRQIYAFAHQIIVVEGGTEFSRHATTSEGHSVDGTLETLRRFQREEDPEHKVVVVTAEDEGHPNGFWPGEKDEMSRAYAKRATGDWLWQVDGDEFYRAADMKKVCELLEEQPDITAISFPAIEVWGSPDFRVDGYYFRGTMTGGQWHRLFRWEPDYFYKTHRLPTVLDAQGRDLRELKWLDRNAMQARGIFMFHYSLMFPKQVRAKVRYYVNRKAEERVADPALAEREWHSIPDPFHIHNIRSFPSWLEPLDMEHPEQFQRLWNDIQEEKLSVATRDMGDARRLMRDPVYRMARAVLRRWPTDQVVARTRGGYRRYQVFQLLTAFFSGVMKIKQKIAGSRDTWNGDRRDCPLWLRLGRRAAQVLRWTRLFGRKAVLIVRLDSLGDALLFSGALRRIRAHYPGRRIVMVTNSRAAPFLHRSSDIDRLICIDEATSGSAGFRRRLGRVWQGFSILSREYEAVLHVEFSADILGHCICALADAPLKQWFDATPETGRDGEERFRSVYTQLVPTQVNRHEIDKNMDFVRFLGCADVADRNDVWPELSLTREDRERAEQIVEMSCKERSTTMCVAVCAGARFKQKDWGEDRFAELIRKLPSVVESPHVLAFLVGGKEDKEGFERIRESVESGEREVGGRTSKVEGEKRKEENVGRDHRPQTADGRPQTVPVRTPGTTSGPETNDEGPRTSSQGTGEIPMGTSGTAFRNAACNPHHSPLAPRRLPPDVVNLAGKLTAHESIALIEQSDLCVGNDTFGLHAAIAVGTPSVVVMWGGNGDRWIPWGSPAKHRMVRSKAECRVCDGECVFSTPQCMDTIHVDDVISEINGLMEES